MRIFRSSSVSITWKVIYILELLSVFQSNARFPNVNAEDCKPCQECIPGTFADQQFKNCTCCGTEGECKTVMECTKCPAGEHQPMAGSIICDLCPMGTSTGNKSGEAGCTECLPGYITSIAGSAECTPCPAGHYNPDKGGIKCNACPPGTHQPREGQSTCLTCQPGTSSKKGEAECAPCPIGWYQPLSNATHCLPCARGKYQHLPGQKDCDSCQEGHFCNHMECANCSACAKGYYTNHTSSIQCDACFKGSQQPKIGGTECLPCPDGFEAVVSAAKNCTGCKPGFFKNDTDFSPCKECIPGTYSNVLNSTECHVCDIGTYQALHGQKSCVPCIVGTHCSHKGCATCEGCPRGHEAPFQGSSNCTECRPGYCKDVDDNSLCQKCDPGSFQIHRGQLDCNICPKNFYCPRSDHNPIPCTPGSVCPAGSTYPKRCDAPFFKIDEVAHCHPTVEFITLIICVSIVAFVIIVIVSCKVVKHARKNQTLSLFVVEASERQTLTTSKDNSPPVYTAVSEMT